jgi:peptidoglycan hydrolase CwlO-like protein
MSSDKFQRQMDFILEQQAKFDARFDAKMLEIEEKQRQNTEDLTRLVGAVMNLTLDVQENSRQIAELIEHGKETDKRIAELRQEYDARQKYSDARINALIEVVERYFSNGQKS